METCHPNDSLRIALHAESDGQHFCITLKQTKKTISSVRRARAIVSTVQLIRSKWPWEVQMWLSSFPIYGHILPFEICRFDVTSCLYDYAYVSNAKLMSLLSAIFGAVNCRDFIDKFWHCHHADAQHLLCYLAFRHIDSFPINRHASGRCSEKRCKKKLSRPGNCVCVVGTRAMAADKLHALAVCKNTFSFQKYINCVTAK